MSAALLGQIERGFSPDHVPAKPDTERLRGMARPPKAHGRAMSVGRRLLVLVLLLFAVSAAAGTGDAAPPAQAHLLNCPGFVARYHYVAATHVGCRFAKYWAGRIIRSRGASGGPGGWTCYRGTESANFGRCLSSGRRFYWGVAD